MLLYIIFVCKIIHWVSVILTVSFYRFACNIVKKRYENIWSYVLLSNSFTIVFLKVSNNMYKNITVQPQWENSQNLLEVNFPHMTHKKSLKTFCWISRGLAHELSVFQLKKLIIEYVENCSDIFILPLLLIYEQSILNRLRAFEVKNKDISLSIFDFKLISIINYSAQLQTKLIKTDIVLHLWIFPNIAIKPKNNCFVSPINSALLIFFSVYE